MPFWALPTLPRIAKLPFRFLTEGLETQTRHDFRESGVALIEVLVRGASSRELGHLLCHQTFGTTQQMGKMGAPTLQGVFAFCQELVPLIHGSNAGDRAALMI